MHIGHPLLRPEAVEFRGYQANLARIAGKENTLVVLPTGMGKTIVALLVLADALKNGAIRVLVLAPTRPLVEQHGRFLEEVLAPPWNDRVRILTGQVAPSKRAAAYKEEAVLCATPQVIQNDIVAGRLDVTTLDWVVYDEAHRAVGDYPYTFIGEEVVRKARACRRLGLTASPGHDVAKIDAVRQHLGLGHVEIRTPEDPDVAPYVKDVRIDWETLPLPPGMARVSKRLHEALAQRIRDLKSIGLLKDAGSRPNRRQLLECGREAQGRIHASSDPDPKWYQALSLQAQAMKLQHAIELVETQGAAAFVAWFERARKEAGGTKASKAQRVVVEDPLVVEAYHIARHDDAENPKFGRVEVLVRELLDARPDGRIILFAQFRTTCDQLVAHLKDVPGARPVVFVGQGRRGGQEGLTQRQQVEVLDRFRDGTYNVLVATSVAEEGLDIPATDMVVFFEPIPSEIRSIQRRGRTGRQEAGRVVVLMTKGTQDEAAHWIARRKERQMVTELQALRARLDARRSSLPKGQTTLDAPAKESKGIPFPTEASSGPKATVPSLTPGPRILCDAREQAGGVVRHLHSLGADVETRTLEVADFILSDRVAVERKAGSDFVDSLLDGRLFEQLRALRAYPRPYLVLEGDGMHGRNVAPEALMGALASVTMDYGIPVLQTRDALETARFLVAVAKREQGRAGRSIAVRLGKPHMDDRERQRFLLAGLPGVSGVLADRLLERFGSVASVFQATEEELSRVEGIGPTKAAEIRRILELPAKATTETV